MPFLGTPELIAAENRFYYFVHTSFKTGFQLQIYICLYMNEAFWNADHEVDISQSPITTHNMFMPFCGVVSTRGSFAT